MNDAHGLIPHQPGYHYIRLEEDFVAMFEAQARSLFERSQKTGADCKKRDTRLSHAVAKAYISTVLENLSNWVYQRSVPGTEVWVYLSFPELQNRLHGAYKERTLKDAMKELIEDGYVFKRPNRDPRFKALEYHLCLDKYSHELKTLPSRSGEDRANLPGDGAKLHDTNLNLQAISADLHDTGVNPHECSAKLHDTNAKLPASGIALQALPGKITYQEGNFARSADADLPAIGVKLHDTGAKTHATQAIFPATRAEIPADQSKTARSHDAKTHASNNNIESTIDSIKSKNKEENKVKPYGTQNLGIASNAHDALATASDPLPFISKIFSLSLEKAQFILHMAQELRQFSPIQEQTIKQLPLREEYAEGETAQKASAQQQTLLNFGKNAKRSEEHLERQRKYQERIAKDPAFRDEAEQMYFRDETEIDVGEQPQQVSQNSGENAKRPIDHSGRNNGYQARNTDYSEEPIDDRDKNRMTYKEYKEKRKAQQNGEESLTEKGQHIVDLFEEFKRRKILLTAETISAANRLGNFVNDDTHFMAVLSLINSDPFLKQRQVRWDLDYVYRKYDKYFDQVEQMKARSTTVFGGMTVEERRRASAKQREFDQRALALMDIEEFRKLSPDDKFDAIVRLRAERKRLDELEQAERDRQSGQNG